MTRIGQFFVTASHLRPKQFLYQIRFRLLGLRPARAKELIEGRLGLGHHPFLQPASCGISSGLASFVGCRPVTLAPDIDWRPAARSKLWRYNLHYFDYLHWAELGDDLKVSLIDSWIGANSPGSEDSWEPYPISLRTVNWIKWFWAGKSPMPHWSASLSVQLAWLDRNIEYHLLANHLVKNAKALVFGGLFFRGRDADSMLQKGLRLMSQEGAEQILPDGGQFERSAMYHAIALEDYLDVVNVVSCNPNLATKGELDHLTAVATRALRYYEDILAADGEIPLFNDAALGVTAPARRIVQYGRQVLGIDGGQESAGALPLRVEKTDTGYFGYRHGGDSLLIDCGPGGPDYQPGHTHADTLSYELCIGGRRIVVDSGTYDYENTELRHYLRGTSAHNTVRVDGADQSEVWGAFRVARRAKPLYAELGPWNGDRLVFRGAHDGYRRLPGRVVHERTVKAALAGTWEIVDRITGSGQHRIESFINLHPDCTVTRVGGRAFMISCGSAPVARIDVTCDAAVDTRPGTYCPEFGRKLENTVLVLSATTDLPAVLSYAIRRA